MSSSCEKLIQFDTEAMSSNLTTMYAALQFVNAENYEAIKQSTSASVPGYFDGSYDEFKSKRNKLTQLFLSAGFSSLQQDYYRHSLSPAGAEAYARCMAEQSQQPIAAWISQRSEESLAVTVRCGLPGQVEVDFTVGGEIPLTGDKVYKLNSGGSVTLLFKYARSKSFLIAINATVITLNAQSSTVVYLPAMRDFQVRTETKKLTEKMLVGAGCQGNSSGCQFTRDVTFVADEGFSLDPLTIKRESEAAVGGPGVNHYAVDWSSDEANGKVRRIVSYAHNVDGNSGHAQGINEVVWSVVATREYLAEVTA